MSIYLHFFYASFIMSHLFGNICYHMVTICEKGDVGGGGGGLSDEWLNVGIPLSLIEFLRLH